MYECKVWYVLNVVQRGAKFIPVYMIYSTLDRSLFDYNIGLCMCNEGQMISNSTGAGYILTRMTRVYSQCVATK